MVFGWWCLALGGREGLWWSFVPAEAAVILIPTVKQSPSLQPNLQDLRKKKACYIEAAKALSEITKAVKTFMADTDAVYSEIACITFFEEQLSR